MFAFASNLFFVTHSFADISLVNDDCFINTTHAEFNRSVGLMKEVIKHF